MKWFHRDKDDNNGNFAQMEIANESGNEEVPSHTVAFEKELQWFEVRKESLCSYLC